MMRFNSLLLLATLLGGCATQCDIAELAPNQNHAAIWFENPQMVHATGRPGVRLHYKHFSVAAPTSGRWACLRDAEDCALFISPSSGNQPQLVLATVSEVFAALQPPPMPDATTNPATLVQLEERALEDMQEALTNGTGVAVGMAGTSTPLPVREPYTSATYLLRSQEILPDSRFAPAAVRFKAVFAASGNLTRHLPPSELVHGGILLTLPDKPGRFVRAEYFLWQPADHGAPALETAARDFLSGLTVAP